MSFFPGLSLYQKASQVWTGKLFVVFEASNPSVLSKEYLNSRFDKRSRKSISLNYVFIHQTSFNVQYGRSPHTSLLLTNSLQGPLQSSNILPRQISNIAHPTLLLFLDFFLFILRTQTVAGDAFLTIVVSVLVALEDGGLAVAAKGVKKCLFETHFMVFRPEDSGLRVFYL